MVWRAGLLAAAIFFGIGCASHPTQTAPTQTAPATSTIDIVTAPYLTDMHQLTFAGKRAGEGYFSHDGRYMVFQSEREKGNPFYQIFLMDLKTGATRRISPGQGKTSCSWISPDNQHILFASTHADPKVKEKAAAEWEERKHPKHKYSWSFDDTYDIYATDMYGKNIRNLTHSPGYDAEGSYSPDGKYIAFASNRAAYTGAMSAEEKALFERDPSTMTDIYLMRADGSDVKRLTAEAGYDGGPFFSPDGKRIIYRHFTTDGQTAEVFTMNLNGGDKRQLTHLKAMSWAPFYHPSGDYVIFTTNKQGYANFELYIVDTEGKHQPVRVTDLPGFDGLPVFTPDGKALVWAHTNDSGEAQLFRAKWSDRLARQSLGLEPKTPQVNQMATSFDADDALAWVEYLASNHLHGRPTGGAEEQEYMATIARAYADMGLKPLGPDFLQTYEFTSGIELDPANPSGVDLQIGGVTERAQIEAQWIPLSYSKTGHFPSAGMVFAGYGMVAPAAGGQATYDSYKGLDVKDKWVVVFSGLPDDISNERRFFLHTYSRLQHKAMMARQHGAAGLVVIEDTVSPAAKMHLNFEGRSEDAGIAVVRLSGEVADRMFASAHTNRKEWTLKLAKGEVAGLALPNTTLQADVNLKLKRSTAHNAIAVLNVPGAKSTVLIGAHGDHLGHGEMGNSLWRGQGDSIHHGADDNASGVAGVIEIARDLTTQMREKALKLKQNIAFAVWTGEEIGILGSSQFAAHMAPAKISAYLNMDMIGRYRDQAIVQGLGSAGEWRGLVEQVNAVGDPLILHTQDDPYLPSDALTFYMKQIPILMLFTGSHAEYHTPMDTADRINAKDLARIAAWVDRMGVTLASSSDSLVHYQKVESTQKSDEGRGFRLYLGTVPDYTQEGKNGVVISGTSKDSPAERAGLKAGDTIIELGGMKIQNLYDYVYCLQALKANQKAVMRVRRGSEEKALEITPVLKVQ